MYCIEYRKREIGKITRNRYLLFILNFIIIFHIFFENIFFILRDLYIIILSLILLYLSYYYYYRLINYILKDLL